MNKILILLKLGIKFSNKYIIEYLKQLIKPFLIALLGIMCLFVIKIDVKLFLISFLSIPCLCYAFWKGYKVTYELIPCANNYIKNTILPLSNFSLNKKQEKELIKYVCFVAIFGIILYLPSLLCVLKIIDFSNDITYIAQLFVDKSRIIDNIFLINTLLLAPFLNYSLCAFYYKGDNENYFKLFLNCYTKLDILGFLIAFIITLFSYKLLSVYIILALFINPFIYGINTFWYSSRLKS